MKKIQSKRKRIKRKKNLIFLTILPLIIFISLISTTVKAGTQDSTLTRNKIPGIYSVAPLADKTHLYNLEIYTINNKIAYCIEINKSINTSTYNSTIDIKEQMNITKLTKEQLEYIKTIINFGYGYKNNTDYQYYMAAQELIWEYLNNIDISWTNELNIDAPKIDIENYKNEILTLVNTYNQIPNITKEINCHIGEIITLTDNTNSLRNYIITDSQNQDVKIEDNKLIININKNFIGTTEIKLQRQKNYNYQSNLFYSENTQQMLSTGNQEDNTQIIKLNIEGATLTTTLLDQDTWKSSPLGEATLAGAVYELYDANNQLLETFTTDKTGINTFQNLYYGKYYIKQIKASKGYILSENIVNFEINSSTKNVILTQKVIRKQIKITKLYEVENNYIYEPNVIFNICTSYNSIYTSFYTGTGTQTVNLPYGTYIIKQMTTTYGYNKINDITVKIDENTEPIITYTLKNDKLKTKLYISTKDEETNTDIITKEIEYKIKNIKTNEYITYKDENNNIKDTYTTNENGQVQPDINLPYGEYQLEQITPPETYLENSQIIYFTINEKTKYSQINNELVLKVDFYNTPIKGKLKIISQEEKFITQTNNYQIIKESSPNVKFDLYYEEILLNTYQTNSSGKLELDNLKLGNYCIKTTNTNQCFELINYNNIEKVIEKEIIILKKINTKKLIINNIDSTNNPINNTIIEIYYQDKLINTSKTNEEGLIKLPNLIAGTYCLKQKEIEENYIINKDELCFEITEPAKDKNITITNNIIQSNLNSKLELIQIKIPNTLSNKKNSLLITPIILILGVITYKKYKKVNNN